MRYSLIFQALLLFSAAAASPAVAEERFSPFRGRFHGQAALVVSSSSLNRTATLRFRIFDGFHSYVIKDSTLAGRLAKENGSLLFEGAPRQFRSRFSDKRSVALDYFDGKLRLMTLTRRRSRPLLIEADIKELGSDGSLPFRVRIAPRSSALECAEGAIAEAAKASSDREVFPRAATRDRLALPNLALPSFRISAVGDYDFYLSVKKKRDKRKKALKRAQHEILSALNGANTIYADQLGIQFRLGRVSVDTSKADRYGSTSAEQVLFTFRSRSVQSRALEQGDIHHLLSGIRFSGSVVGLAFVGTVCRINQFAFGLSGQTSLSIRTLVMAHEIAHNMGASHVNLPNSIMSTVLGPGHDHFSTESISEIQRYLSLYGACMGG
ncbi:MAG: hypothetical protein J5J00_01610 [Deltaproteobacteria bacterium]|nr:hypothetical protein [Deltaproteobacteria bacterium]